ncbi:MAG: hypothetical protein M3R06_03295 [Chloroflexota bacterium]|nr:hypothetical protein [Chloroflexota bacterium]
MIVLAFFCFATLLVAWLAAPNTKTVRSIAVNRSGDVPLDVPSTIGATVS